MKYILAFLALLCFTLSGYAQNKNLISITYQRIYTILPEQDIPLPDTTRYENDSAKLRTEQMEKEWRALLRKKLPEENETVMYTFNDSIIRFERQLNQVSEDEFILIEPDSGLMFLYYTDTKEIKQVNKIPMHAKYHHGWQVRYTVDTLLSDRKNILGYNCFKMIVKQEVIRSRQDTDVNIFELFVTDRLNLPARLTLPLRQPVVQLCALEIKSFNLKSPYMFLTERAIEIKKEVDSSRILLPEPFKNIRD